MSFQEISTHVQSNLLVNINNLLSNVMSSEKGCLAATSFFRAYLGEGLQHYGGTMLREAMQQASDTGVEWGLAAASLGDPTGNVCGFAGLGCIFLFLFACLLVSTTFKKKN